MAAIFKAVFFLIVALGLVAAGVTKDDEYEMHPHFERDPVGRASAPTQELESKFWRENAQDHLRKLVAANARGTAKNAKNIILFLGDGMSLTTVAAARMYLGAEQESLSFEKFQHFGLSKTYCVDAQVADSACSATAYLSGVKANIMTMGLNAKIPRGNCKGQNDKSAHAESIAGWAQRKCKATGLVTTSRVTHASPGGLYAHIAHRDWENDAEVRQSQCDPTETVDIARQLVESEIGRNFKVVLGGGRREFRDEKVFDEENVRGNRGDGKDLIDDWLKERNKRGNASYVFDKAGLNAINLNQTDFLLGLFEPSHCQYNLDVQRQNLTAKKPTLSEMTSAAIKLLQKEENGFFLFVEGARIDMAHHETKARKALDETKEFHKAIQLAREMTSESDTLIVVTADHGHTMTYNGYPKRGSDILGLAGRLGSDMLPYATLSYANGLGYYETYNDNGLRSDLSSADFKNADAEYPATVPLEDETHGGEDVGVYASGPRSELFVGNYEQSSIPMLMAYATQIGPYAVDDGQCSKPSASAMISGSIATLIVVSILKFFL